MAAAALVAVMAAEAVMAAAASMTVMAAAAVMAAAQRGQEPATARQTHAPPQCLPWGPHLDC